MIPKAKTSKRRTQTERSDAMRKRLLDATLKCLAHDGYAGTTVSSIVRRAKVSRGAQVHHYPSKDALILDATEHLMRRAYRTLGDLLLGIADEEDRLQALVNTTWEGIFDTPMFNAFAELMIASQRDRKLADSLHKLCASALQAMEQPSGHYFEARPDSLGNPLDMFVLMTCTMSTIACVRHLDPGGVQARHILGLWLKLIATQIRARKGVMAPPPKPLGWKRTDQIGNSENTT
ncbi:MAG: TetR/AcrR family transcriptional regulator [Stenotrophobium sp.]